MRTITSLHNPDIRNVILLREKSREREKQELFIIEGFREFSLAVTGGFSMTSVFYCPELLPPEEVKKIVEDSANSEHYEVSLPVYNRIAFRHDSEGILALAKPQLYNLHDLDMQLDPLILILESIEKPGNLGALLRTADAANLDAVIICDPLTDVYNPNAVRSSLGCIFTVPVVVSSTEKTQKWLRSNRITSYATSLSADLHYHNCDFRGPTAFVMGTESTGLSEEWLSKADHSIKIPMSGRIDSMNVSVSAAIVVFEARRQRNFKS
ncbi:MAG: RNA methyltransferase [Bacteroidetes bacterium]|nr:MAG: RNA methyltransferase [Bacteroidota bacterium]